MECGLNELHVILCFNCNSEDAIHLFNLLDWEVMSSWLSRGEFNGHLLERIRLIRSDGPPVSYNLMWLWWTVDSWVQIHWFHKSKRIPRPGLCNCPLRTVFVDGGARCPWGGWGPKVGPFKRWTVKVRRSMGWTLALIKVTHSARRAIKTCFNVLTREAPQFAHKRSA